MDEPTPTEAIASPSLPTLVADEIDQAILIADARGHIVYGNPAFGEMFGYAASEVQGLSPIRLLAREGFDPTAITRLQADLAANRVFSEETLLTRKDGSQIWVSSWVKPIHDKQGALLRYLLVFSDIDDSAQVQKLQRDALEAIAQDRPLYEIMDLIARRVEAIAPDVICSILSVDDDARLRPMAGPTLPQHYHDAINGLHIGPMTGSCGTCAFTGEPVTVEDIETDPLWAPFKSLALPIGLKACWSSPITVRDGRVAGTFAFYYRETRGPSPWHKYIVKACVNLCVVAMEHHEAKERIARLAYYDSLTGLPNRRKLREEMEKCFDEAEAPEAALIFLDVDHFKDVNDTLGHAVGDSFLIEIADRLRASVWPEDIIARHGGDEFVIVLKGANAPRAERVAEVLLEKLSRPVAVDGLILPASASIGITVCPRDGADTATLMRNADAAMYQAKGAGRNTYRFFTPEMNRMAQDRILLGSLLRDAIEKNQLSLNYQPQIDARTGRLAGVEALARWRHPALGDIPPSRFIPLAEDCGLISEVGRFAMREALWQLSEWDRQGFDIPQVAVNMSPTQFRTPTLPQFVQDALQATGLSPARLVIEITEGVMMDASPAAVTNANTLRAMGVSISMDDFGTGYSSLSHLARLPVNELKIDRSFMANLEDNDAARALVTAVIRIGESLRLRVVAEGVETLAQRRFLEALGCDILQGYLFGGAMTPPAFLDWMLERARTVTTSVKPKASAA
jgi:diguanylate cyclase (GGDEF)-like protein/PAS domain S-box-containing protein